MKAIIVIVSIILISIYSCKKETEIIYVQAQQNQQSCAVDSTGWVWWINNTGEYKTIWVHGDTLTLPYSEFQLAPHGNKLQKYHYNHYTGTADFYPIVCDTIKFTFN